MKKEISLRRSRIDYAKSVVMNYVEHFAKFLSALVEEEISPFQSLCILQVLFSFTILVFSVCVPLLVRLLMLSWFVFSLWQCKRAGLK